MNDTLGRRALVIFASALAIRLIHVWQISRAPFFDMLMGDARGYDVWARQLAGGDWIGRDPAATTRPWSKLFSPRSGEFDES